MKTTEATEEAQDVLSEYHFDYSKAKPNRFTKQTDTQISVTLDPDVARVFTTSEAVNKTLKLSWQHCRILSFTGKSNLALQPTARCGAFWYFEARIEADGWFLVRRKGSHRQFHHLTKPGTVTVSGKLGVDVPPGTCNSTLKQAGLK